jgi:hypothetical protein
MVYLGKEKREVKKGRKRGDKKKVTEPVLY